MVVKACRISNPTILDDFDYIIELRNDYDEEIQYNLVDEIEQGAQNNFSMFDF